MRHALPMLAALALAACQPAADETQAPGGNDPSSQSAEGAQVASDAPIQLIALDPRMRRRCLGLANTFSTSFFSVT